MQNYILDAKDHLKFLCKEGDVPLESRSVIEQSGMDVKNVCPQKKEELYAWSQKFIQHYNISGHTEKKSLVKRSRKTAKVQRSFKTYLSRYFRKTFSVFDKQSSRRSHDTLQLDSTRKEALKGHNLLYFYFSELDRREPYVLLWRIFTHTACIEMLLALLFF